ncbi:MAG: DegT/DnrJ/EryC1/StrS family aminotransferase [Synergistota bacterium]|jgi:dTDP-4-amino-4,6-dideoxygalactose transaminase|nr:DegT/DnrJ/EryC1/StrS family aminotransferase [Synergistota bacterium]OPZ40941.1 MAG: UDP-2-acetamido-2-deoxy-3-oxo-D-glucuronate aminotransferase [Synergistetes bacterium ADurb.BinA166]
MAARIPTLDLVKNYSEVKDEMLEAIRSVLESQSFIMGPEVRLFEEECESYLEGVSAVGCASGTDALLLALMALDVGEGDEVITTPYSFFATASSIVRLGAVPVFVDVDPKTYNIDLEKAVSAITPRTKAFIPVHLFGQMAPLEECIVEFERRGATIVEDAAQAFGATRIADGRIMRAGAMGRIGCFSFFPTKNLGAYGDGGMIVTTDEKIAGRLRRLRVHGADSTYFHDEVGLNSRLDTLQAAVLRVKLRHLEEWNEQRRVVAGRYYALFAENGLMGEVTIPFELQGNRHIYHQYVVRVKNRDELQKHLDREGITSRVYYPLPLHLQRCFSFLGKKPGDFPESELLSRETLALPVFPELAMEDQARVVGAIKEFYMK